MKHLVPGIALALLCATWPASAPHAQEPVNENAATAPFPRALTLGAALSMLDGNDPALMRARARGAANEAARLQLTDRDGLTSSLGFDLRAADRLVVPGHEFIDDSSVILVLDKPLTRFGADKGLHQAIDTGGDALAARTELAAAEVRHRAIGAFFNVILSDYAYAAQDEIMTLAFLEFEDAQSLMENHGEVAEVEVRRLEALYLDAFAERTRLGHERRASRLRLALALNRGDAYPDSMVEPDLDAFDRETPDYDETLATVLEHSAEMRAARLETAAARQHLDARSLAARPTLGARFQAAEYRQKLPANRDQFRASLYLDIPLDGDRLQQGAIAAASARLLETEAVEAEVENALRLRVLGLVQRLAALEAEIAAAEATLLYSELDLDRVRLLYEMEVRARIGSANAEVAGAVHRLARGRYQRALTWDHLDILMNNEPVQFP